MNRRIFDDKVLRDKALNIAKDPKYNGYQRGLASMVYNFLIKRILTALFKMRIFLIKNYQLLES